MNEPELAACSVPARRRAASAPAGAGAAARDARAARRRRLGIWRGRFSAWIRPEPAARAELAYAAIVAGLEQETFVRDCLPDSASRRSESRRDRAGAGRRSGAIERRPDRRLWLGAGPDTATHAAISLRRLRLRERCAFLAMSGLPQLGRVRARCVARCDAGDLSPLAPATGYRLQATGCSQKSRCTGRPMPRRAALYLWLTPAACSPRLSRHFSTNSRRYSTRPDAIRAFTMLRRACALRARLHGTSHSSQGEAKCRTTPRALTAPCVGLFRF